MLTCSPFEVSSGIVELSVAFTVSCQLLQLRQAGIGLLDGELDATDSIGASLWRSEAVTVSWRVVEAAKEGAEEGGGLDEAEGAMGG